MPEGKETDIWADREAREREYRERHRERERERERQRERDREREREKNREKAKWEKVREINKERRYGYCCIIYVAGRSLGEAVNHRAACGWTLPW